MPAATDPARFGRETGQVPADLAVAMLALPHTLILQHRETVAVLATSALFMAAAMILVAAVGG